MEQFIQRLMEENGYQETHLLEILRQIQARYHHIPEAAIEKVAELLDLPRTRIISVIEFYSFFHLEPQGQYEILVSDSITDHMLGKQSEMDYLSERLDVKIGAVRADGRVSLNNTSCTGLCEQGPAGLINGYAIPDLNRERIDQIVALIEQQAPLTAWPPDLFYVPDTIHQSDLLLGNDISPGSALEATFSRGLEETLQQLDQSGLRGRGGAGFNTAMKWRFCRDEPQTERYVVCNADEGEPGTFKDRVLLNSYADQVFEGMTLCAAIIGAQMGYLYLRGEYLFLYEKLQNVLEQRRLNGLLGDHILGHDFSFEIEIRLGAGAYICGEESALLESMEGKRGIPRNRPPYPVSSGFLGKPTVVNNVETLLAAAYIGLKGADSFAALGTEQSRGTKILSICGDCQRPGIYEYPFGVSIQKILKDCGAENTLGVQIGGPSGTFICDQEFDRKLAFEDLPTGGSFIIFDQSRNVLDIVDNFTRFFAHESCGFCTPCRVGTSLLKQQIEKIVSGHGSAGDLVDLESLCQLVKQNSHCGLGQTAANPVLTTLQRYPEKYEALLQEISFEPGFDLDGSLAIARQLTHRDDPEAHLTQTGE